MGLGIHDSLPAVGCTSAKPEILSCYVDGPQPNPIVTVTLRLCGAPSLVAPARFLDAGGQDVVRFQGNMSAARHRARRDATAHR